MFQKKSDLLQTIAIPAPELLLGKIDFLDEMSRTQDIIPEV